MTDKGTSGQCVQKLSLIHIYYTQRKAGAYSQKGTISNLKEMNETFNYLRENGIYKMCIRDRLGSLLKHITYNNERSASYEKKRENHSIVRAFEP